MPRGGTALLDAVGRAINETGERLGKMAEEDRPGLVVFVVLTDGQENSSQEFSKSRIKKMIVHQQEQTGILRFWEPIMMPLPKHTQWGSPRQELRILPRTKLRLHTVPRLPRSVIWRQQHRQGEEVLNDFTAEEREDMS